ncbi:uroporphyrinogen-III synthase [Telmatospirillum siberiense]|uniref:Uroporphyrinogen-III synthase n=1 Tax=Telmatospirillum siberiense TaxID=382514 RepID=A0A2N3PSS9_9PROT|nr:uroporphyrinogen-III synthase [Telmatospirillum siberiense]PKU23459.1 uroporphyrinogen-III synthase [Telmatospirillum siberiense]
MRALVTRPREDAEDVSRALESRGFEVRLEPLLDIHIHRNVVLPLDGVQGLLATSANGVRALAANDAPRTLPLWAVGAATAARAREQGFQSVESAGGDVARLAELVARRVDPAKGALLHAAGSKVAGDLSGALGAQGFEVRRAVLYEARTATGLTPSLLAAMGGQELDLALFFSPRTAATFARLVMAADVADACRTIDAGALSEAVAGQLAVLPWRRILVAATPDQAALLAVIDADRGH